MADLLIFPTLTHATRAGFAVFDRTAAGYLVRARTRAGWTIALVPVRPSMQDNG